MHLCFFLYVIVYVRFASMCMFPCLVYVSVFYGCMSAGHLHVTTHHHCNVWMSGCNPQLPGYDLGQLFRSDCALSLFMRPE